PRVLRAGRLDLDLLDHRPPERHAPLGRRPLLLLDGPRDLTRPVALPGLGRDGAPDLAEESAERPGERWTRAAWHRSIVVSRPGEPRRGGRGTTRPPTGTTGVPPAMTDVQPSPAAPAAPRVLFREVQPLHQNAIIRWLIPADAVLAGV